MNQYVSVTPTLRRGLCMIILITGLCDSRPAEPATPDPKPDKTAQPVNKAPKKAKKTLTGAELYAIHCNRCHPERYAPERTEVQWKTILTHMRVRANVPAEQARSILKFLQEDSGK
jgi:hypothetical protein